MGGVGVTCCVSAQSERRFPGEEVVDTGGAGASPSSGSKNAPVNEGKSWDELLIREGTDPTADVTKKQLTDEWEQKRANWTPDPGGHQVEQMQSDQFAVQIQRRQRHQNLGLIVDLKTGVVEQVEPGGLVDEWNRVQEDWYKLLPGDRILAVNGLQGQERWQQGGRRAVHLLAARAPRETATRDGPVMVSTCPAGHNLSMFQPGQEPGFCAVCASPLDRHEYFYACEQCRFAACLHCVDQTALAANPEMVQNPDLVQHEQVLLSRLNNGLLELLDNREQLRRLFSHCWQRVAGHAPALDLQGLYALCQLFEEATGLPGESFGDLQDTYIRFDFNGNRELDFNEAYACLTCCVRNFRKRSGLTAPVVEFRTPEQSGYVRIKVLAAGGQGEAILVTNKDNEEMVLKTYSRQNANAGNLDELIDEMENMKQVEKCPYLAHCFDIFQDPDFLYMVSGLNSGGDWSKIKKNAQDVGVVLSETWYRALFEQAFAGLGYLHNSAVMHCDLKEENLMVKDKDYQHPHVVIIDLGLSQTLFAQDGGPSGTPGYIPPETWRTGKWFPRGDVFSMGVVCMQMLVGEQLAPGGVFTAGCKDVDEIIASTLSRQPPWHFLQRHIRDWLTPCLAKQMMQRPRVPQILQMPWFLVEKQQQSQSQPRGMATPSTPRQPPQLAPYQMPIMSAAGNQMPLVPQPTLLSPDYLAPAGGPYGPPAFSGGPPQGYYLEDGLGPPDGRSPPRVTPRGPPRGHK